MADPKKVALANPWTQGHFTDDMSDTTQAQLDAWAGFMDEDLREELHSELAPCTPGEFIAAWAERVGPEEAGRVILES